MIFISKNSKSKLGWAVSACFSIHVHGKEITLLNRIQSYFKGAGNIKVDRKDSSIYYSVTSIKDLTKIIIPHFENCPLLTQKRADFLLFKRIVILMSNKEHLTAEGLRNIISIRAAMNNGLSDVLKEHFTDLTLVERPVVELTDIGDFNWIVGFVDGGGGGSFGILITKAPVSTGYSVGLRFTITQHVKDLKLIENFVKYFNCGWVMVNSNRPIAHFIVSNLSDIIQKIYLLFLKYPLESEKFLDFNDFVEIASIIKSKNHLTEGGLDQIRSIKSRMNRGRK